MGQSNSTQVTLASIALLVPCWKIGGTLLHNYFTNKMTVLNDLSKLGVSRPDRSRITGTAVIIGGRPVVFIAGLWTARVCADHFEDVLVIEPELWTGEDGEGMEALYDENGERKDGVSATPRQRVMQYNSSHGFQPIQLRGLRRLFPEADKEIKKTDARVLPHEYNTHAYGGHVMRIPTQDYENPSDVDGIFMSRENYERLLRRLVRKSSGRIRWLTGTAIGLKTSGDSAVIDSVIVRTSGGHKEYIPASLVIDCAGPSQLGLKWLKHIFQTEIVSARPGSLPFENLRLEYKSMGRYKAFRFYVPIASRSRLPIRGGYDKAGVIFYYVPRTGTKRCNFVVNRIEGHRIELSFIGCDDPPSPKSIYEIKDYWLAIHAEDPLPVWLFDILNILLEYEGPVQSSDVAFPPSSWIRYEQAPYIPSNFIAIGDSVMRVNPTYGQGCSKAAMGAITLDNTLRSSRLDNSTRIPAGFGYEFFKKYSGRISGIWNANKSTDYRSSSTIPVKGENQSDGAFMARYASTVVQLSLTDEQVNAALWKVRCFLAPPTALFHPLIMGKIASFWLKQQIKF